MTRWHWDDIANNSIAPNSYRYKLWSLRKC